ncbi:MAG: O-antigen ligase family protein [Planctomycetales bacterium]|nr:O-antigen ligase family protein [Planctomycetales bacterium]
MRRLLLAIILLELPLQIDANLFRDELDASHGAISGINVSLTTICLIALYAMSLPGMVVRAPRGATPSLRAAIPLFVYLCVLVASVVVATDTKLAFFEIVLLFQTFLLFVYLVFWTRTKEDVLFVVGVLLLGVVIQGTLMMGVKAVGHDIGVSVVSARVDEEGRIEGTLGSPNDAAAYLTLFLVPSLAVLTMPLPRRYKLMAAAALVLGVLALLLTLSRGGLLAFGISCGVFCLLACQRGRMSWRLPVAMATIALVAVLLNQEALAARFTDDDGSASARLPLAELAAMMISDHPLIGVGANNCSVVSGDYVNTVELRTAWLYVIHNKYLLVWVESGILGLAAYLWFLVAVLRRGWVAWQLDDRILAPLGLAFAAAMFGQMFHMLVDVFHSRVQVQNFWLVAALIVAIYNVSRDEADDVGQLT